MALQTLWFVLWGLLWAVYFIVDEEKFAKERRKMEEQ